MSKLFGQSNTYLPYSSIQSFLSILGRWVPKLGTCEQCLKCYSPPEFHEHRKSAPPLQSPRVPGTRRGAPRVSGTPGKRIYLALPILSCATSLLPGRSHSWSGGSQRGWGERARLQPCRDIYVPCVSSPLCVLAKPRTLSKAWFP